MAFTGWTNEFTLRNPEPSGSPAIDAAFQLQQPELGNNASAAPSLGNYQLSAPDVGGATSSALSSWGPSAIGAAGQTVGGIAQVAGQKAAMDRTAANNELGRAFSEHMARLQLAASAQQADQQNKLGAYELLLRAYGNQQNNALAGMANNRNSAAGISDLLARAMLTHPGKD